MKTLISTTVSLLLLSSIPASAATQVKCTGDAVRSTPPVVNYPTHVRNVVWRNMRAMCQQQPNQSQSLTTPPDSSQSQETPKKSQ